MSASVRKPSLGGQLRAVSVGVSAGARSDGKNFPKIRFAKPDPKPDPMPAIRRPFFAGRVRRRERYFGLAACRFAVCISVKFRRGRPAASAEKNGPGGAFENGRAGEWDHRGGAFVVLKRCPRNAENPEEFGVSGRRSGAARGALVVPLYRGSSATPRGSGSVSGRSTRRLPERQLPACSPKAQRSALLTLQGVRSVWRNPVHHQWLVRCRTSYGR